MILVFQTLYEDKDNILNKQLVHVKSFLYLYIVTIHKMGTE